MKPGLYNLWLIFIPAYAIIWGVMIIVNSKRGKPIEDPELMERNKKEQLLFGFYPHILVTVISVFVPISFGANFIPGLIVFLAGFIICIAALFSFSGRDINLNTKGIYTFSRNPMYLGMYIMAVGLCIIAFTYSFASFLFIVASVLWVAATHRIVIGEEKFLSGKYGESYDLYKEKTARYLGVRKS